MPIIQTVLGPVQPNVLGRTLTHEHLAFEIPAYYRSPPAEFKEFLNQKFSMETLGYVRQYPYSKMENVVVNDEAGFEWVRKDVELYKKFGGGAIVENSSHGLKRNMKFMCDVSRTTGVHVIAGTGHYIGETQEPEHLNMTVEQMCDLYTEELTGGVDVRNVAQKVKCGFIGEVGSVYPISEFEKRAIRATGEVQETLGCAVSFHPGRDPRAPFEIVRLYLEAGGRADKCVMSHLERTFFDFNELLEFAKLGTFLQYDLFGTECSFYQLCPSIDMPSDAQRINNLVKLISEGYEERVLMSHDVHTKHRLTSLGGHGFHHVHMNVVPRFYGKGVSVSQMEKITVTNPANWLQFNPEK